MKGINPRYKLLIMEGLGIIGAAIVLFACYKVKANWPVIQKKVEESTKRFDEKRKSELRWEFEAWKRLHGRPDAQFKDWYWIIKSNQPRDRRDGISGEENL